MRKNYDKAEKRKKFLVYFIGIIMVFSAFGVIFWSDDSTGNVRDKGLKFVNKGNYWLTSVDGKQAMFAYTPSSVEFIEVDENIINRLKNAIEIDVTSEFNDTYAESIALAQFQMGITLRNFNVFVRNGFTGEKENFPRVTCNNATSFIPVIYFRSSNETKVYLEDSCIVAEALSENDVLGIKDRLVYGMFDIIK